MTLKGWFGVFYCLPDTYLIQSKGLEQPNAKVNGMITNNIKNNKGLAGAYKMAWCNRTILPTFAGFPLARLFSFMEKTMEPKIFKTKTSRKLLQYKEPYYLTRDEIDMQIEEEKYLNSAISLWVSIIIAMFLFIGGCIASNAAHADVIDMSKIAMIESSGCKHKNGDSGDSIGCYQVKDALVEWNQFNPKQQYTKRQMLNDELCLKVANWYINKRIPQMLRAFKKPVTARNQLIAYNAGISYVVKNKKLPRITISYLRKYGV